MARPQERVEVKLNVSFKTRAGELQVALDRPSSLIGIPYDRPIVGYGGKTISTLRLWEAAAPDYFDFEAFSHGDFVGAVAETLEAESLTRVLYPDDSTSMGQGLRFIQEYFLVACSLADIVRRFRRDNSDWKTLPDQVAMQLNDTHPSERGLREVGTRLSNSRRYPPLPPTLDSKAPLKELQRRFGLEPERVTGVAKELLGRG